MFPPIARGTRVIVNGNEQPYATAIVIDAAFIPTRQAWQIYLEWPHAPGGVGYSCVYSDEEGKNWQRHVAAVN